MWISLSKTSMYNFTLRGQCYLVNFSSTVFGATSKRRLACIKLIPVKFFPLMAWMRSLTCMLPSLAAGRSGMTSLTMIPDLLPLKSRVRDSPNCPARLRWTLMMGSSLTLMTVVTSDLDELGVLSEVGTEAFFDCSVGEVGRGEEGMGGGTGVGVSKGNSR